MKNGSQIGTKTSFFVTLFQLPLFIKNYVVTAYLFESAPKSSSSSLEKANDIFTTSNQRSLIFINKKKLV